MENDNLYIYLHARDERHGMATTEAEEVTSDLRSLLVGMLARYVQDDPCPRHGDETLPYESDVFADLDALGRLTVSVRVRYCCERYRPKVARARARVKAYVAEEPGVESIDSLLHEELLF